MFCSNPAKKPARSLFALVVLLSCLVGPSVQAEPVAGTTVTLTPPEGFQPARDFTGFIHEDGIGTIFVEQGANDTMAQSLELLGTLETAQRHLSQFNHRVTSLEQVQTEDGRTLPLFKGSTVGVDQSGREFVADWWLTYFAGPSTVVVSMRSLPAAGLEESDVVEAFGSVRFGAVATVEQQVAGLPFSVEAALPYRLVSAVSGRNVLLTDGEKDSDPQGQQSNVILSYEFANGASQEQVAEGAMASLGKPETVTVDRREDIAFAGRTAKRLEGRAKTPYGDKAFVLYAALQPDGYYVVLLATANEGRFATLKPAIEQIAESVTYKG